MLLLLCGRCDTVIDASRVLLLLFDGLLMSVQSIFTYVEFGYDAAICNIHSS